MKKLAAIVFVQLIFISSLLGARVGLKTGINYCVLEHITGKGFHVGIDVGFDIRPCFAIDIAPQVKSSQYKSPGWPGSDYEYMNLFAPIVVSVKSLSATAPSPYLGVGAAVNFQLNGKMIYRDEVISIDGVIYSEQEIEDLKKDVYFVAIFGVETKLARFRISPEFSFNYNLTDNMIANHRGFEDRSVSIHDFALTIGLCYLL